MPNKPGPKTPEGKARSAKNALKHGLLSRDVILADEDPADFDAHASSLRDHYAPLGPTEEHLVDELINTAWLLKRHRRVESITMNKTYADTLPIGEGLAPEARRQRALISTFCNDILPNLNRYGTAAERKYFRILNQLRCLQESRRTGALLVPGSFRVSVVVQLQPVAAELDQ